jgi:voltage-gated potassium channel
MKQQLISERKKLLTSIEKILEGPMIFLGFVWLVLLVIEMIWGSKKSLQYITLMIWVIFIIDFLVKLILAPGKLSFLKNSWLTIISLLIPALRIFSIFRFINVIRGLSGVRLVRVITSVNRSITSLGATMKRRAFAYVFLLILLVIFGGAAGMFAFERTTPGFQNYGMALWWTAMRVITAGNEFFPATPEGRTLAFMIAMFGYAVFGYVTATLASFFIGRDAEEKDAPIAGADDIKQLKSEIKELSNSINELIIRSA